MTKTGDDSEDSIRSIARALRILRAMNARQRWSLHDIHLQVSLPKSTIFRILHTLQLEGYVRTEGGAGLYRLTDKVHELGSGYTEKLLAIDVGSPIALRVTKQIKWPLAIGILDGDAIVVRYSTMPYSPLAVHTTTLGQRLGLLDSAAGRVYLAFCSEDERSILLNLLKSATADGKLHDEARLLSDFAEISRIGYAVRLPNEQKQTATVAVPVLDSDEIVAVLTMTTFGRLMTAATISKFTPILKQTASEIGQAYEDGSIKSARRVPAASTLLPSKHATRGKDLDNPPH